MIAATGGRLGNAPEKPRSHWCDCGMVLYHLQPEGHYAAKHIYVDGVRKRFSYPLHCWHLQWHRKHDKGGKTDA